MKKFMTVMLGLSLVLGATAAFAGDDTAKDTTNTKKAAKKTKAKKTHTDKH